MTDTPKLGITQLGDNADGNESVVNEGFRRLEVFAARGIIDRDLATPPGSPTDGDAYIVAAAATGDWTGHEDDVTWSQAGVWKYWTPTEGAKFWVQDEDADVVWDGAAWAAVAGGGGGDSVTVNGVAVVDVDLDDATPAAPAGAVNVVWQKDASSPANVSAHVAANGVSDTVLRDSAARSVIGRAAGTSGDPADIAASSGSDAVLRESGGSIAFGQVATAGIADDAVTLAKLADIVTDSFLGRTTAATGDPEVLTTTQATGMLKLFTAALKGLVPPSGGGTATFMRADGTWSAATLGGHQVLTDAATIAWDASLGAGAEVTLGGNRTLGTPTNLVAGQVYHLNVIQDGTGGRTLAWPAIFDWRSGGSAPTVTATANARDLYAFYFNGTNLLDIARAANLA